MKPFAFFTASNTERRTIFERENPGCPKVRDRIHLFIKGRKFQAIRTVRAGIERPAAPEFYPRAEYGDEVGANV
jgi:hypothetical protein